MAYLIGSIPFGFLLVRSKIGKDIRMFGSGNIGATNAFRIGGKALGMLTLVFDLVKGAVAVLATKNLFPNDLLTLSKVGLVVVLGHIFPIWLKFKGGKGVATALGVMLVIEPMAAAFTIVFFVLVFWKTRIVSVSSICAAFAATIYALIFCNAYIFYLVAILNILITIKHKGNIVKLYKGQEKKLF